jgi:hypothetical protein
VNTNKSCIRLVPVDEFVKLLDKELLHKFGLSHDQDRLDPVQPGPDSAKLLEASGRNI